MTWIEENKKEITRKGVELDKENAQAIYDELENDKTFCLEKKIVCEKLGLEKTQPRPQTLTKWIKNTIDQNKEYSLKIGESSEGYYIFRRVD